MSGTLPIAGKIYQSDGSTVQENAVVWVYNKTQDEYHSGRETAFPELITNSSGEWQVNLANFDDGWSVNDEIWVSAMYEDHAQNTTFKLTGNPVTGKNLTLKNLEPHIAVMKLLWSKLDDPNSTRDNPKTFIRPKFNKTELERTNYPLISVELEDEDSEPAGITSNQAEENTPKILITVYVWSKSGNDKDIHTISGINYEGTKLRDYIGRKITNALRSEFDVKPGYNKDAIVNKFYNYTRTRYQNMPYDDEADHGIMKKEIEIELKTINQEV